MKPIITLLLSVLIMNSSAQEHKQTFMSCSYNYQVPFGKLSKRFGKNSSVGFSFLKERNNNIFYGLESNYLFGNNVKDTNIFDNIATSNGSLIDGNGQYANVNLMERGFDVYLIGGYAYHLKEKDLSGIYLSFGIGFIQHKIFIDTKSQNIPQLEEEYKQGYDKLTNGISTKWEASYKYYSKNGRLQVFGGINLTMAYTKNRRPYIFNEMLYTQDEMSWDNLFGVNIGVIIPVHRRNEEKFHYY